MPGTALMLPYIGEKIKDPSPAWEDGGVQKIKTNIKSKLCRMLEVIEL